MQHWHVVHRKNKRLSSAAQAFREFLLTEARQLMPAITYEKSEKYRRAYLGAAGRFS